MIPVKLTDHFENDLSHHRIGANCARVIKSATVEKVRISPENFPLASCSGRFGVHTQKHRDVFVAVEAVGQTAVLRRSFSQAYALVRPRRLAVLGCTTGADFDVVDPAVTEVALGVDINAQYLAAAERRSAALGRRRRMTGRPVSQWPASSRLRY